MPLRGRQRIVPVPHALWSTHAADFVATRLTVGGETQLQGAITFAQSLVVSALDFGPGRGALTRWVFGDAYNSGDGGVRAARVCFLQHLGFTQVGEVQVGFETYEFLIRGACRLNAEGRLEGDSSECAARCILIGD